MSNTCHFVQVQMFVDATYGIVPHPFYQCLIIMVFDMARRIYIPCAWVLMTGKSSECYWQVFNWLTTACPDLDPSYIGVDFERAFLAMFQHTSHELNSLGVCSILNKLGVAR